MHIVYTIDVVTEIISRVFNIEDIFRFRHLINALTGWLIILFTFFIGKRYFDVYVGLIAAFLLFISPRFLGHALNNPKDIHFAMGYVISMYMIMRFSDQQYKPKWKETVLVGLSIGLALNVRIGGLILFAFIPFIAGLRALVFRKKKVFSSKYFKGYLRIAKHGIGALVIGYIAMIIFWPFGLEGPFTNPLKAFDIMSDISIGIRQLFEGNNISSAQLPSYYTVKWMYISIPLLVILGLLLSPVFIYLNKKNKRLFAFLSILSFCIIPMLYIFVKGSNVYGGWRHSIFVYPSLTLIASIGLRYSYKLIKQPVVSIAFICVSGILALLPITHILRNYPVHYVYFNEIAGGVKSAYGNYEMDYYMHSIKPANDWLVREGIINDTDSISLASNHSYSTQYYNRNRGNIRVLYTRYYERLKKDWDYAIYINVYIDQPEILNEVFPPIGTIHTIEVGGKPVCAIVKNPSKAAIGYDVDLKEKNYSAAAQKLNEYYKADNRNFESTMNLAIAYQGMGNRDSFKFLFAEGEGD